MILYEYEGKKLLKAAGIAVPNGQVLSNAQDALSIKTPLVLKAQVLSGKRADAGGIIFCEEISNFQFLISNLLGKEINKEKVEIILVEEKVEIEKEFYVSISYDTDFRAPILSVSKTGGTGIEERGVDKYEIDPLDPISILKKVSSENEIDEELLQKLVNLFFEQDYLLLEINPLVKTKSSVIPAEAGIQERVDPGSRMSGMTSSKWMALDAKVKLDDFAKARHPDWEKFPPRSAPGHNPTKGEIAAKKIDEGDYRGTAGSSYFDLEGDIAVLSSGGGVSLTALDSLISYGGKPANFTEYSGNPPKEKVTKLTKIVLDKPNIHGLWVIGTVVANFTDIYETLSGFVEGLREIEKELGRKIDIPIVIRRGGPRVDEAYEMLRKVEDFDLHLQGEETSIAKSAKTMADLAQEYTNSKRGTK